jgi:hypothetical protein
MSEPTLFSMTAMLKRYLGDSMTKNGAELAHVQVLESLQVNTDILCSTTTFIKVISYAPEGSSIL